MKYVIKPGQNKAPVYILLHGTGGTEESLLDVGKELNKEATLIGIRGSIMENGYPRFFRRLEEGVYNIEDLNQRTLELDAFIRELANKHEFELKDVLLIGYSNGANIGIKLLLDYPESYQSAVLFHPMYPVEVLEKADLSQTNLFITMGRMDPIVSVSESENVLNLFKERQATITEEWTEGHQLTFQEVARAREWLQ